jgi:hypothetical protein
MSPLPPKANIRSANTDVRYGPIADMAHLFDHLVDAGEQRRRKFKAKCLRGFHVDDKIELGGLYNWSHHLLGVDGGGRAKPDQGERAGDIRNPQRDQKPLDQDRSASG